MNRLAMAIVLVPAALLALSPAARGASSPPAGAADGPHLPARGAYAVVVSAETLAQADWKAVCDVLLDRYAGRLVTWKADVTEARPALAEAAPNYVCFVARPTECGRAFVAAVHRMTRRLDADPYTDCLWGILTGYEAADALRLARFKGPRLLRKVLSGTSGGVVEPFEAGIVFFESRQGRLRVKEPGGPWRETDGPADSTRRLVDFFNRERPDCFITSGHATEHDWQIGYTYKDGQLRCKDGRLFGIDTQGRRHPIDSPNPKVHLPVGNCLIGHVPGADCMVTALVHSAGVVQMFGYTVPTWFGAGGWGIQDFFLRRPGRFTLAEAFFANTQAMLLELHRRFPKAADIEIREYDLRRLAAATGLRDRTGLGLLWDRDTVAFYGDPALDARPPRPRGPDAPGAPAWDRRLEVAAGRYTLTIECRRDGTWPSRPVFALLPHRLRPESVHVIEDGGTGAVATELFVMVPLRGKFKAGDRVRVVVAGEPARRLAGTKKRVSAARRGTFHSIDLTAFQKGDLPCVQ